MGVTNVQLMFSMDIGCLLGPLFPSVHTVFMLSVSNASHELLVYLLS